VAAEQALDHYKRSTWPTSTCIGEIAGALYLGPTPVSEATRRCEGLLEAEKPNRYGRANVEVYLGGLFGQTGDFERAFELIGSARTIYDELGQRAVAAGFGGGVLSDVELLAGDARAAAATLRWLCDELDGARAYGRLASRAGDLANVLYELGQIEEAVHWIEVAEMHSAIDDLDARVLWMPVRAMVLAREGELGDARTVAYHAVELAESTDTLNRHARAEQRLGEVLVLSGDIASASEAFARACALYEAKGNLVGLAAARSLMNEATPV
jgi:tetratricopeptide (TPR) repeat protein